LVSVAQIVQQNSQDIVHLRSKLANRFYEPTVLLVKLNELWAHNQKSPVVDGRPTSRQTPKDAFQCFLNKLAQICDTERGGKTVTAFTVLKHPDHIEYVFASNQRKLKGLVEAQGFVKDLLTCLGEVELSALDGLKSAMIRKIICFGKPRIQGYIGDLKAHTATCIEFCKKETTDEGTSNAIC
jgi:cytochrome P450